MSSCSSCTSGVQQYSIQQELQKQLNPTPQQLLQKQTEPAAATSAPQQDALNTSGPRGTQFNFSA